MAKIGQLTGETQKRRMTKQKGGHGHVLGGAGRNW